jgi:hypothetical protein
MTRTTKEVNRPHRGAFGLNEFLLPEMGSSFAISSKENFGVLFISDPYLGLFIIFPCI